jgi:voltage-dependent potassium channel beta subunit
VSVFSFGSWVTFANKNQIETATQAAECLSAAKDAGVNFFDNAEAYGAGESERVMGAAFRELGWQRHEYVVSTKLFWGLHEDVNMKNTLNRKYLSQAIDASLERFGLDFVDLVFCHRADPQTPIEETVWAMSDMISQGKALYWGTSEWTADEIRAAYDIADRHHLHKPLMEQPQYNILWRDKVDKEYKRLYEDIGLGTTIWSPLSSGLLTGKYLNGVPEGSRATLPGYEWLKGMLTDEGRNKKVAELKVIADELDVSLTQLSLAWCAKNPNVSTVITGASTAAQVRENMTALDAMPLLTKEIMDRIDVISYF